MTQAIFDGERLATDADARMALTRLFRDLDEAEEQTSNHLKSKPKRRIHGVKTEAAKAPAPAAPARKPRPTARS